MKGVDYWHTRLSNGELDPDERAEFERWRADPANAAAYAELERLMAAVDELMATPEMIAEADAALAQLRARRATPARIWRRPAFLAVGGAGALTAALLLVAVVVPAMMTRGAGDGFSTAVGEQEMVELPDGSHMTLNTASEARVRFAEAERRVVLVEGQALFDVAPDLARPFVVAADGTTVTAVGTVFDVRKDQDAITVTLVEGLVDVNLDAAPPAPAGEPPPPEARPPGDLAPLEPGEQLRVSRRGATTERRVADVEATVAWTRGVLIFKRTRLEDAIAEVNRYTTRPLRLGDPSLAGLELSGVFRAGERDGFALSLAEIFPVRLEERPGHTLVLARTLGDPR